MTGSFMASIAIKATVILALGLGAHRVLRRSRAAVRHLLLLAVCATVLTLPVAALVLPVLAIPIPYPVPVSVASVVLEAPADVAMTPVAGEAVSQVATGSSRFVSITQLVLIVEMIGATVALLPLIAGLWQTRRLRAAARQWPGGQKRIDRLVADTGIRRRVDVLVHDDLPGPVTYGMWGPVLLFPADAKDWEDKDFERAAIHELEHVRRHDWATDCFARVACAVYWFHPLAWVTWRQLRLESERAADDAVVRAREGTAYADLLVTLAERLVAGQRHYGIAMASRRDLPLRIQALLDASLPRGRAGRRCIVVAVLLTASGVLGVAPLAARTQVRKAAIEQHTRASSIVTTLAMRPNFFAQSVPLPAGVTAFEVASIRHNKSGDAIMRGPEVRGHRLIGTNLIASILITNAYNVRWDQIVGAPAWLNEDRFDLEALAPDGANSTDRIRAMLRTLLADRFGLRIHTETRQRPVYALVPARVNRVGPQLRRAAAECAPIRRPAEFSGPPPPTSTPQSDEQAPTPLLPTSMPSAGRCPRMFFPGLISARSITLAEFAYALTNFTDRTVLDQTGVTGEYDIDLTFRPDFGGNDNSEAPPLITALQEQLGLKLEPAAGAVQVLVIDQLQKPSEN